MTEAPKTTQHLLIISGLSGAGKKTALQALEDHGCYCIDNLPARMLEQLEGSGVVGGAMALVMDIRDPWFVGHGQELLATLRQAGNDVSLVFLEAENGVLLRRFNQTRRRHPVAEAASVATAIEQERQQLSGIRQCADYVLDTSELSPHQLARQIVGIYPAGGWRKEELRVAVCSFGFKHGIPTGVDMVVDVRFLPNPHFIEVLRPHTGLVPQVADFVINNPETGVFFDRLLPLLTFLLPQYTAEGKVYFTLGIGCTGGKHRSVAIAEKLGILLRQNGQSVTVVHRDLGME